MEVRKWYRKKFTDNEAKNFIEYLTFTKENGSLKYTLKLYYRVWRENHRIFTELRIGQKDDGIIMEGKARELLKAIYLKLLRDAEREILKLLLQILNRVECIKTWVIVLLKVIMKTIHI